MEKSAWDRMDGVMEKETLRERERERLLKRAWQMKRNGREMVSHKDMRG